MSRQKPHRLRLFALAALVLTLRCSPRSNAPLYSGTIEAVEVDVVPEVAGRLIARPVDEGDRVEPGTTVGMIDPEPFSIALSETEAALAEARAHLALVLAGFRAEEIDEAQHEVELARAQLAQAESRLERLEELVRQEIATADDLDVSVRDRDVARARLAQSQARLSLVRSGARREEIDQARAEVRRLEALEAQRQLDLDRTTVVSPLAGTVTEKLLEPGEYARPGSPIVAVADLTSLYTWVYLTSTELPRIKVKDRVEVHVDAFPGRAFPGEVVYISPEAEFTPKNVQTVEDRAQLVFGVKVAVDNPDGTLKVGLPADVVLAR